MRLPGRPAALALLAVLAALAARADGQSAPTAAASQLRDDAQFAENLARYRFFDLASDVLTQLKAGSLDTDGAGTVAFTEARILKRASENTADEAKQLDFLTQAIDKLADWAKAGTPYVYHEHRLDALEDLAAMLQARGQLRTHALKAAAPAQQEPLRAQAEADFKQAADVLTTLKREYKALGDAARAALKADAASRFDDKGALTLFHRGLNSLQWADVAKDPEAQLGDAKEALEDYQWALDEEKISQYFALHYEGVVLHKLGKPDEALDVQHEVLEKAQYWWDNLASMDATSSATIAELFDRTWGEVAALQADKGDVDAGDATIDTLLSRHAKAKLPLGQAGYQVLLTWAERLTNLGRRPRASALVKQVADGAASLPEGERARDMLATLLTSGGSGTAAASASTLLAGAKGLYDRKDYAEAAYAYLAAAAAIKTPEDSKQYAVNAWLGASRSLANVNRHLESALACEHALDAAVAAGLDKDTQGALATEMYGAFDRRAKETGEPFDRELKAKAIERVGSLGVGSDLPFLEAKERFDDAAAATPQSPALYDKALEAFQKLDPAAPSFERALVYVARCQQGAGRTDEALKSYDALLARAADPAQAPADAAARTRREIALGEALYFKADLLLSDTLHRPADALKLLEGVEDKLPSQAGFVESAKYQRILAWTQLGELDKAAAGVDDLKAFRADSSYLRTAWFKLSSALLAASDKAAQARDAAGSTALLVRAADALWNSAELAGFPSFTNVMSSGDWYTRAGRFDRASRSYQKALDVFDKPGGTVPAAQLDQARLGLAAALNTLRDFAHARTYWKDLLARNPKDPVIMSGSARCFGGWLERGPGGSIVEVEGSGDYEQAASLWSDTVARLPSSSRYQSDWWEARLLLVYTRYRQGKIHPALLDDAHKTLRSIAAVFPDYDGDGAAGAPVTPSGPPFKPFFKYLEKKLPEK